MYGRRSGVLFCLEYFCIAAYIYSSRVIMVDQGISVGDEQDMVVSLHVVIPIPKELDYHKTQGQR